MFKFILSVIFVVLVSGCSPGMFSENLKDQGVLATSGYRKINTACSEINLSSSTLQVKDFREVLTCFNSNGALSPIQELVQSMTDAELKPLVDATNKYLLNDKKRLYAIEQSYYALDRKGIVEDSFRQMGHLLENASFITSSIVLLKDGRLPRAKDGQLSPDPEILKAIELLSRKLSYQTWTDGLDLGKNIAEAPAFQSAQKRLQGASPQGRQLRVLTDHLFEYLKESHTYECSKDNWVSIRPELTQAILAEGSPLFSFLDKALGTDPASLDATPDQIRERIKNRVAELASVFQAVRNPRLAQVQGQEEVTLLRGLSEAFGNLNHEIKCMNDSQTIPNGAMHLIRELNEPQNLADPVKYILRDNRLNLVALAPFCKFPEKLDSYYQVLTETAETGVMSPMADLITRLYREPGLQWKGCDQKLEGGKEYPLLAHLFVNFLGDSGFNHLLPSFDELTDRNAWVDVLLLLALPSDQAQTNLRETMKFLVQPMAELNGKSIFDVMLQVVSRTTNRHLFDLAASLSTFVDRQEPLLEPALTSMRRAFYVNNVHPVFDLLQDTMAHATENDDFFNTLFLISDKPQFVQSIKLVSDMAKDGRLRQLVSSVVTLFHKFADEAKGIVKIEDRIEPPFVIQRRHELKGDDVKSFPLVPVRAAEPQEAGVGVLALPFQTYPWYTPDCRALRPSFSFVKTPEISEQEYATQLTHFLRCQSSSRPEEKILERDLKNILVENNVNRSVENSVVFLRNQKTDEKHGKKPFFDHLVDLGQKLLSPESAKFLVDAWISDYDKGAKGISDRILNTVPFWIEGPAFPVPAKDTSHSVLKPLLDTLGGVAVNAKTSVQHLETFAGHILEDPDFPKLMADVEDLSTEDRLKRGAAQPRGEHEPTAFDERFNRDFRNKIREWVRLKECVDFPPELLNRDQRLDARVQEIIDEAKNNVTNWDLVPSQNPQERAKPRQSWSLPEIKEVLEPVFAKVADQENQSVPGKWVLDSHLDFLKYFTLAPGAEPSVEVHYPPNRFLEWLYERSIDYRLITYFYPGETKPRVRLVNTLDLLELELYNVDSKGFLPPYKNMGLDFLQEIAEGWGDLPRALWPKEIQEQFPEKEEHELEEELPQTLLEVADDIHDRKKDVENLYKLTYWFFGLPKLPDCYQNLPGEEAERQAFPKLRYIMPISSKTLQEYQEHLYNLWQVGSVLNENAPGSHLGKFNGGKGGGLDVLRDLFFGVLYSTPEEFRNPSAGEANNLSVILHVVRMGALRQIGRQLHHFKKPDPANPRDPALPAWTALNDVFTSLIRSASSPSMRETLVTLLKSDQRHELVWQIIQEIFDVIDHGTPQDLARMKQLGFYGLAGINRLQGWAPSPDGKLAKGDLADLVLASTEAVVKNHRGFLLSHTESLKDLLKSEQVSSLLRVFYEDPDLERRGRVQTFIKKVLSDEGTGLADPSRALDGMRAIEAFYSVDGLKESWNTFRKRHSELKNSRVYQELQFEEALRPILRFFEQRPEKEGDLVSAEAREASDRLRLNLASLLKTNELSQFLLLAGDPTKEAGAVLPNSGKFYQVLQTFSQLIGRDKNSPVKDFLKNIVRPSLSEKDHPRYSVPHVNTRRAIIDGRDQAKEPVR